MSENLSPVTAETSTDEDDIDSSKRKSKKKALGTFVVETEPPKKKETLWSKEEPTESLFSKKKSVETPAETENSAENTETLTTDEKVAAVQQLASARQAELANEVAETDVPTSEAEIAAVAAFLAAAEALGDTEAAYQQITAELAAPIEVSETEIAIDEPQSGEIDLHSNPLEGAAEANDEDEEDVVRPPATTTPSPASVPTPRPQSGSGGPGPSPAVYSGPGGPNSTPNLIPATAEAVVPMAVARSNERRALTDGLIVGGIVGYLYGRRRGRIKTEKRLAPVQRQLEKQVNKLQTELLQTEDTVRLQARKLQQLRPRAAARLTERWQRQTPKETIKQPERLKQHVSVPPERIGHVLVAASATRVGDERLKTESKPSKMEGPAIKKRADTMTRSELLAISETVQVDGTSLRQIYETKQISEKGLRRLVTEHLRSGNVARALRKELVEHEIDFERDPILRDRGSSNSAQRGSGAGKTALSGLLAQADMNEPVQTIPIGSANKQNNDAKKPSSKDNNQQRQNVIDGALVTLISVLVIAVILVLQRG